MSCIVKFMNTIEQGEAISLAIQSSEKKGREKQRLFRLCRQRFESAISSIPDDEDALTNYGKIFSIFLLFFNYFLYFYINNFHL